MNDKKTLQAILDLSPTYFHSSEDLKRAIQVCKLLGNTDLQAKLSKAYLAVWEIISNADLDWSDLIINLKRELRDA